MGGVDREVILYGSRDEVARVGGGVQRIHSSEDERVVEEQEVRPDLLGLLEDLRDGGERDQHPVRVAVEVTNLEPWVVPVLRQSVRDCSLYGLRYLLCARHKYLPCLVQSPSVTGTRIAEILSAATRLPLLAVPLFLLVGATAAGWRGALRGLLCLALTSGLSLLYLVYLARAGRVREPLRNPQEERVRPLHVVAGLHGGAWMIVTL